MVGLAAACAVAGRGHGACVLERLPRFGLEASTHNSGVIHAGLYYPEGSLKAALCVEGRERLYAFCAEQGVPAERCGKLVVASDGSETPRLEALAERARGNGVDDVELGRPGVRPAARTACRGGGGALVAVDRHHRGGGAGPGAGAGRG